MTKHVIYVPGLGDSRTYNQDKALRLWRLFGIRAHFFPLGWADKEPFEPKLRRLLGKIDELQKDGQSVSLVGVSAGGGAVINAYAQRKNLTSVICVVGKIHNPQSVGNSVYKTNPAFKQSAYMVEENLKKLGDNERRRIMSIHPLKDFTVPIADTKIAGAEIRKIWAPGHISAIFVSLVFGGAMIARFIRRNYRRLESSD